MSVIAAIDFSSLTTRTAELGLDWARRLGEPLVLVHVVSPPPALPHEAGAAFMPHTESTKQAALARLEEARMALQAQPQAQGVSLTTHVLLGRPEEALAEFAQDSGARLLVLGTHSRGAAARLFLGSVSERIARQAPCPTLLVPLAEAETAARPRAPSRLHIVASLPHGPAGKAVHDWLAALRQRGPCDVSFVHIFDAEAEHRRLGIDGPYEDLGDDREVLAVLRRELEPLTALPGEGRTSLSVRSHWGPGDDPLAFEATAEDADLLVLGTWPDRGERQERRALLATLRATRTPTLCIPARRTATESPATPLRAVQRILIATDFSEEGNEAVRTAYRLARAGGACVELCHVTEAPKEGLPLDEERAIRQKLLALIPEEARQAGIRSRAHVALGTDPATAILQSASRLDADVIVLASRGLGNVKRALLGSVADAVVRAATVPVVVLGPATTAPAGR